MLAEDAGRTARIFFLCDVPGTFVLSKGASWCSAKKKTPSPPLPPNSPSRPTSHVATEGSRDGAVMVARDARHGGRHVTTERTPPSIALTAPVPGPATTAVAARGRCNALTRGTAGPSGSEALSGGPSDA